jgi:pectinesterase
MMRRRPIVLSLSTAALLALVTSSMAKDLTVAADGSGDYKTLQSALDAVPRTNTDPVKIFIKPGTYEEKIDIPSKKGAITLIGQGKTPEETVITFHLKASDPKTGVAASTQPGTVGTTGSASVTISGSDISAENLTFANSAGLRAGQAVALKTNGDRLTFKNCRFTGYQDTLYLAGKGRVYLKDCFISGSTDFIFGNATAVFDHCTIKSETSSFITAANTAPDTPYGFVLVDCTLTAADGVPTGSVYLGRPWQWDRGTKSAVMYIRTKMGPQIAAAGWHPWDATKNVKPEENTRYSEMGSMDADGKPLDVSGRVAWAKQLSADEAAKLSIAAILAGSDAWNPTGSPDIKPMP